MLFFPVEQTKTRAGYSELVIVSTRYKTSRCLSRKIRIDEYPPAGILSGVGFVVVVGVVVDEEDFDVVAAVDVAVVIVLTKTGGNSRAVFRTGTVVVSWPVVSGDVAGCVSAKSPAPSPAIPKEKPPVIRMAPDTIIMPRTTGK